MPSKVRDAYNKIALAYVTEHGVNEHRAIPALKKFMKLLPPHGKVLDLGCGGGQDTSFLDKHGYPTLGIDISREMIKLARHFHPDGHFQTLDMMKLTTAKKFDGIWCCRVFQHISLEDQDNFFKKVTKLLKKDGILYLTSLLSHKNADYEMMDTNIMPEHSTELMFKKRLTAKSFKDLLKKHHLKIIKFEYWKGGKFMSLFAQKDH